MSFFVPKENRPYLVFNTQSFGRTSHPYSQKNAQVRRQDIQTGLFCREWGWGWVRWMRTWPHQHNRYPLTLRPWSQPRCTQGKNGVKQGKKNIQNHVPCMDLYQFPLLLSAVVGCSHCREITVALLWLHRAVLGHAQWPFPAAQPFREMEAAPGKEHSGAAGPQSTWNPQINKHF